MCWCVDCVRIRRIISFLLTSSKTRLKFHGAMMYDGFIRVSFGLIANYGIRTNVTRSLTRQNIFRMEKATTLRWLLFRLINRDLKLTALHEHSRFNFTLTTFINLRIKFCYPQLAQLARIKSAGN